MTEKQLQDLYVQTEHGTFTPNYTYDDFIFNEETEEYEYVGFVIQKTAQEVYAKWLENKEESIAQEPTLKEKISVLEEESIKSQTYIAELESMVLELQQTVENLSNTK